MLESEVIEINMRKNAKRTIILINEIHLNQIVEKKLVTRLPNFPDRRIRYESFFFKKKVKPKKI